jgi:outer membrane receptor for ferrienterochelin and colicins
LILLMALLLPVIAFGDGTPPTVAKADLADLSLEELMKMDVPTVYAASKVEQKTTAAPSSVTIITSDEIKKQGYRTLADVLQSVQGFNVSNDRNYAFLGVRGISLGDFNSRVLLLVDGHRINNNLSDGAPIGTDFPLDIDLIERVEIIRGPGSVMYGNNAFLAVINVIPRAGKQLNGTEASVEGGSFDSYKARVSFGKEWTNGLRVLLSGALYDSAGPENLFFKEFDTRAQNNGIAHNMDRDQYGSGFASVGYGDFTLEGSYIGRNKLNPTAQFDLTTFNDPRLQTSDERSYVALNYTHSFEDVVDVAARLYYDEYDHRIGFPQSLLNGSNVLFTAFTQEEDRGQWWGAELQLSKTLWERLNLTLGGEYRDDFLQETLVTAQPAFERTRESHGIYLQGDYAIVTNLHLLAGARYDQYGDFDPSFNPRVALIYEPLPGSTFKAIYGTAFRAPNFTELSDPRFQNISPEEITGYELAYEQQLGPHLRSSLSGFYNAMDHLIVFDSGNFTNFNAEVAGMELAFDGNWSGLRGRASYSFEAPHDTAVRWDLPDSPSHMLKLDLSAPLWRNKVFAGVEFRFVSSRRSLHNTSDTFGQPLTVQGTDAGAYGIVNLTLFSRELINNLELSATVYNLLDRRYEDPASKFHVQDTLEQDGRSFRVKLTYRF